MLMTEDLARRKRRSVDHPTQRRMRLRPSSRPSWRVITAPARRHTGSAYEPTANWSIQARRARKWTLTCSSNTGVRFAAGTDAPIREKRKGSKPSEHQMRAKRLCDLIMKNTARSASPANRFEFKVKGGILWLTGHLP